MVASGTHTLSLAGTWKVTYLTVPYLTTNYYHPHLLHTPHQPPPPLNMAPRAPFPADPDDFDSDPRISYSKENSSYLLEDENGDEWEWLAGPSKWSKTVLLLHYRSTVPSNYVFVDVL